MVIENDLGSIGNWGSIGLLCRSCGAGRWPTLKAGCRFSFLVITFGLECSLL